MRGTGVGVGVACGDIALLRLGLEFCMPVAKPTLEQITDIAMNTSASVNSILRFFKPPIPWLVKFIRSDTFQKGHKARGRLRNFSLCREYARTAGVH